MRCAAITKAGTRCSLDATHGDHCYQHSPLTEAERKRNASRGGKRGGNGRPGVGELATIKRDLRSLIDDVLGGRVSRADGTAVAQLFHCLLRAIEIERKVAEQEETLVRIEALEKVAKDKEGETRWRA
jgi:hypothetical protein